MINITHAKRPYKIAMADLLHNLRQDCWGYRTGAERVSIVPLDVLAAQQPSEHYDRIQCADLQYPLIINKDMDVMDGMHRLCRAYALGHTEVVCVVMNKREMISARRPIDIV